MDQEYKNYKNIKTNKIVSAMLNKEEKLFYVIADNIYGYDFIKEEEFNQNYQIIKAN
jgi:hypothetical protein